MVLYSVSYFLNSMQFYIAADHGGFALKQKLIADLASRGLAAIDLGAKELDPDDDYPQFAFDLAAQVALQAARGILICRSGNGMVIAANKVKGAYAALCHTVELAHKAREHNDANILVLDADYEHDSPLEIALEFMNVPFGAGRHARRVGQIKTYEART